MTKLSSHQWKQFLNRSWNKNTPIKFGETQIAKERWKVDQKKLLLLFQHLILFETCLSKKHFTKVKHFIC
jgi:hypothetical protein